MNHFYRSIVAISFLILYLSLVSIYTNSRNHNTTTTYDVNTETMNPTFKPSQIHSPPPPPQTESPPLLLPKGYRIRESVTEPKFKLYLHPKGDMVSDSFYGSGYWNDCIQHDAYMSKLFTKNAKLTVVDVGANIGSCSMLFASKGHKVYSFEPTMHNFALFNKSIHENKHQLQGRVIATMAGVSVAGTIHMSQGEDIHSEVGNFGNSIVVTKDNGNITQKDLARLGSVGARNYIKSVIYMTTLDHVVKEHVHYMKLDCQGCELKALQGAVELIKLHKVDVIRLEFGVGFMKIQKVDPLDLLLLLQSYDYTIYKHDGKLLESSRESFIKFIKKYDGTVLSDAHEDILAIRRKQ